MNGEVVRGSLVDARRECRGGNDGAGPILLDLPDAARALAISERALWEWTRAGKVPHVRLGRRVLYEPDALRAWVRSQRRGPDAGGGAPEKSKPGDLAVDKTQPTG